MIEADRSPLSSRTRVLRALLAKVYGPLASPAPPERERRRLTGYGRDTVYHWAKFSE